MLGLSSGLIYANIMDTGAGPGWLKVEFVSTQTGSAAIGVDDFSTATPPATVGSPGDRVEIKYKIWIDNSTGKWDPEGDDDTVTTSITGMGFNDGHDIATNEVVEIHRFLFTEDDNTDRDIKIATWAVADDKPQAGAVFYIKDVYLRQNRPGTGLGQPGDYSNDDLYIAIFDSNGAQSLSDLDLFNTNGTVNTTTDQSPDDI